jgi:peptidoglycan/xylan/chitin deacetylase (PgdA/CDA1 family)
MYLFTEKLDFKDKILYGLFSVLLLLMLICLGSSACNASNTVVRTAGREKLPTVNSTIISKYETIKPKQWGEKLSGVVSGLNTTQQTVALTIDACGGSTRSNGYDAKLIDFLTKSKIPATLFITGRWIDANPKIFQQLAQNRLFDIENHGLNHKPASVNGRSAYGIKGCSSVGDFIREIDENGKKITLLTGRKPSFYRSGTDYYDEVAVSIASDLGYKIVSYSVLGDAGATLNRKQVKQALITAPAGAIIILHMNHPESETAEGVMDAIPIMKKNGFKFVKIYSSALKLEPSKDLVERVL